MAGSRVGSLVRDLRWMRHEIGWLEDRLAAARDEANELVCDLNLVAKAGEVAGEVVRSGEAGEAVFGASVEAQVATFEADARDVPGLPPRLRPTAPQREADRRNGKPIDATEQLPFQED